MEECRTAQRRARTSVSPLNDVDPVLRLSIPPVGCRAKMGEARSGECSRMQECTLAMGQGHRHRWVTLATNDRPCQCGLARRIEVIVHNNENALPAMPLVMPSEIHLVGPIQQVCALILVSIEGLNKPIRCRFQLGNHRLHSGFDGLPHHLK